MLVGQKVGMLVGQTAWIGREICWVVKLLG